MDENQSKNDQTETGREALSIVGIGSSAGGLEALKELLSQLPESNRLTFVIAQHMSPNHTSLLRDLLAPGTALAVQELTGGQTPEPNTIYVTPPNHNVEIRDAVLHLSEPDSGVGPKPSINHFFSSLANGWGENSIGIILSGTGSDGAIGLRQIKASGGVTIVQDPEEAKYDSMPRTAIKTGCADLILPANKIGSALTSIVESDRAGTVPDLSTDNHDAMSNIVALIRSHTGFDLSHYKATTVHRRLSRRLALHHLQTLDEYVGHLREHEEEAELLVRDTLISVTSFFRDPEVYRELTPTITRIVQKTPDNQVIRCWIPACATGEEPYTLAILLAEAIRVSKKSVEFLIFATDLDSKAISFARNGVYDASAISRIPEALRDRYLEPNGDVFHISKNLKKNVVFAVQNVVEDPPFSKLHLISCRNLLIYFNRNIQKRVLEIFHYALNDRGTLVLGKSESIEPHKILFRTENSNARVFTRTDHPEQYNTPLASLATLQPEAQTITQGGRRELLSLTSWINDALVDAYAPPSVAIDAEDNVVHFSGDLGAFLQFPAGPAALKLVELVDPTVRAEIRALLYRARREHTVIRGNRMRITSGNEQIFINVSIRPLRTGEGDEQMLVSFEPTNETAAAEITTKLSDIERENLIVSELERELATTREHLQTVVEELETSNEELQSLNEELQSANEELQSTNEELQTSNEELQSTNEELLTVNQELRVKTSELEASTADIYNIKECLDLPLVVVDDNLQISQTNAAADQMLVLRNTPVGTAITIAHWRASISRLDQSVRKVMETGKALERTVTNNEDQVYLMRIIPYQIGGATSGAVLTFTNITDQHRTEAMLREREALYRVTFTHSGVGMALLDLEHHFIQHNDALLNTLGYPSQTLLEMNLTQLLHPDDLESLKSELGVLIEGKAQHVRFDLRVHHADSHWIWASGIFSAVVDAHGRVQHFICQFQDVTAERSEQEQFSQDYSRLKLLNTMSMLIANKRPTSEVLACLTDRFLGTRISYSVIDSHNRLRVVQSVQPEEYSDMTSMQVDLNTAVHHLRALRNYSPVVVNDIDKEKRLADIAPELKEQRIQALIALPFRHGGEEIGVLIMDTDVPNAWPEEHTRTLASAGHLLSVMVSDRESGRAKEVALQQLESARERMQITLNSIADGVITTDTDGRIEYMNPKAETLTGYGREEALGNQLDDVYHVIDADTNQPVPQPVAHCLEHGESLEATDYELLLLPRSAKPVAVYHSASPIRDYQGDISGAVLVFHDVTGQRMLAQELSYRASHDPLTGLGNRQEFEARLKALFISAESQKVHHALCYLDLDQFKIINDTCGHTAGDELLKQLALLIRTKLRKSDSLARLGGDEFGILLETCPLDQAERIATKVLAAIKGFKFTWDEHSFTVGASIGIVAIHSESESVADVLSRADAACYAAKEQGRNRLYVCESDDIEFAQHHGQMHLVANLTQALEQDRFVLFSQPILPLVKDSKSPAGHHEILLRMETEDGELTQPANFIPAAERFFMMENLDRWVIRQACHMIAKNKRDNDMYAVNVSGQSLGDDKFLSFVMDTVSDSGIKPAQLCFEITETAAISHLSGAIRFINRMKEEGCSFALDDFGTGMSSFAYLKNLPVDYLKIDGSFIKGLTKNPVDRTMVEAVNRVGHEIGLITIAEQVEDAETLMILKEIGVDRVQGFAIAKPQRFTVSSASGKAPKPAKTRKTKADTKTP